MPAPLHWNFSPNLVGTPIPIINPKEWEFEPTPAAPVGPDGEPPPFGGGWLDDERRDSGSMNGSLLNSCECAWEGGEGERVVIKHSAI